MMNRWTPADHAQIGELFLAVCDREPTEQTSFLEHACGDNRDLRAFVEALLEQDSRVENLLAARTQHRHVPDATDRAPNAQSRQPGLVEAKTLEDVLEPGPDGRGAAKLPCVEGYRILDVLGHGGMGVVYRAIQIDLKREVALKILPALVGAADPAAVDRFKREAAAAARLRHKNIVPIYDFGQSDAGYYYSMEWVRGVSLDLAIRALAERRPGAGEAQQARTPDAGEPRRVELPWLVPGEVPFGVGYFRRVATWMAAISDALYAAHEQGVIHRDIKPGNLIVAADGRIMITDFGLAKAEHEDTMTAPNTIMGTLRYLSPEQALGRRVPIDHRADIYSLGATFYELLTLRPIFEGLSNERLVAAVVSQDPTPPTTLNSQVPRDLETICLKMIEKLPESRYASASGAAADFSAFLAGRPISIKPPGPLIRLGRLARRRARGLVITGIVLISAIVLTLQTAGVWDATADQRVSELLSQGLVYQHDRHWESACQSYRAVLEVDRENVRALGNLAIILKEQYNAQGEDDAVLLVEGLEYCSQALQVTPNHAGLWNVKGVLLKKLDDLAGSAEAYETALSLESSPEARIAALNNLAEIHWLQGQADAAESNLRASARLSDETGTAAWYTWCDLASLELFHQDPAAIESIRRAFADKAEPGWRLHLIRARIYLELEHHRDFDQALRDALAAQERSRPDCRIERILAMAYLRSGRLVEAITHADKALSLGDTPAFPHLVAAIAEADLGQWEASAERLDEAQAAWPVDLMEKGYAVSTQRGMLWFDTADQIWELWHEGGRLADDDDR